MEFKKSGGRIGLRIGGVCKIAKRGKNRDAIGKNS